VYLDIVLNLVDRGKIIIFEPLLITFEVSNIFWGNSKMAKAFNKIKSSQIKEASAFV